MKTCGMCHVEHDEDGPCAPLPKGPPPTAGSRVFEAKYAGRCPSCGVGFGEGERVCFDTDEQVVHATCVGLS